MDKYLKSKIKLKILQMFNWIPDKQMICLQYRMKTGRKLTRKNFYNYLENCIASRFECTASKVGLQ